MQFTRHRLKLPTFRKRRFTVQVMLFAMLLAIVVPWANCATITLTFPEANDGSKTSGFPLPAVSIGAPQPFAVPPGAKIVSASLGGTFGNDADESDGTTAPVDVLINGVLVARCALADSCTNPGGPYPWNFSVAPSTLNGGTVALTYVQTGQEFVHLGVATLTIVTSLAQTITFGAPPTVRVNGAGSVTASTTATPSSNYRITFSTTSTDCSVTSVGVVKGIRGGSNNCVITASQAGDSVYSAASATQTFSIGIDIPVPTVAAPMLARWMMLLLGVLMLAMADVLGKKK